MLLLQNAQAELEEERRKNYWLYNAFLPPTTAEQIMNGKMPESGKCNGLITSTCDSELLLKQTTTLFSLSDHYILSREWRVIVDQVHTNYHGRPMVL